MVRNNRAPVVVVIHWVKVDIRHLNTNVDKRELTYARSAQSGQRSSQLFGHRLEGTLAPQSSLFLQETVRNRRGGGMARLHTK